MAADELRLASGVEWRWVDPRLASLVKPALACSREMHTLARFVGYGLGIVPFAPYAISRVVDGVDDRIAIEHDGRSVPIDPHDECAVEGVLAQALLAVADVATTWSDPDWSIGTALFAVRWPNHYTLASSVLPGCPFDLLGRDGSVISTQRPERPPAQPEDLVGAGQRIVAATQNRASFDREGALFEVELAYEIDHTAWRQLHTVLSSGFTVSSQAPERIADGVFSTSRQLAAEIGPAPENRL